MYMSVIFLQFCPHPGPIWMETLCFTRGLARFGSKMCQTAKFGENAKITKILITKVVDPESTIAEATKQLGAAKAAERNAKDNGRDKKGEREATLCNATSDRTCAAVDPDHFSAAGDSRDAGGNGARGRAPSHRSRASIDFHAVQRIYSRT